MNEEWTIDEEDLRLAQEDGTDLAHRLVQENRHRDSAVVRVLIGYLASASRVPAEPKKSEPPPTSAPAKKSKPAPAPAATGHRHSYGADGICHVQTAGKECGATRQRARGDKLPPAPASAAPAVDTKSLPIPGAATRHLRVVTGLGEWWPSCGVTPLGPLDVLVVERGQVNCDGCKATRAFVDGGAL